MHNNSTAPKTWTGGIVNPRGRMPIGVSSFKELTTENYTYIDKSPLIQEVLDSGDKVMLLTRPRRFGKTLNMSMLHEFLAKNDPKNDPFEGLAIQQAEAKYQGERGKRPVLFLSFKDIKAQTWEEAFQQIRTILATTVAQYIQDNTSLEKLGLPSQRVLKDVHAAKANSTRCESTLATLTELLTIQNEAEPWVLIDEYDTPMETAYQYGFYNEMRNLMQGLLGRAFKDNDYLHRSVITGIVRIAREDIFSGLNNLSTYGVLEKKFSKHFGFNQEEVDALLDQKGLSEHKKIVKDWYNGYQFGPTTIYNPWSIINFIDSDEPIPRLYWINTSSDHLVHTLLSKSDSTVKKGCNNC